MSESAKYEAYKKKLQGICDENNLVYRFCRDRYPITLTISPLTGLEEQMSMLESVEENGYTSPDASIVFAYKDGVLTYKTSKTFTISDALFSKIKNLYKNLHSMWLQFFFREIIEKKILTPQNMPTIDEDKDALTDAEPIEELEDDEDPQEDESGDTADPGSNDQSNDDNDERGGLNEDEA